MSWEATDLFPTTGRIAAVDFGTVRMGVAVCDPSRVLVSPHAVYTRRNGRQDAEFFAKLADEERIAGFVVGLPIHCDGQESDKSRQSRRFARWLAEATGRPIRLFDERFTTVAANRRLLPSGMSHKKRKNRLDAVAAQVLLESFLEACAVSGTVAGHRLSEAGSEAAGLDDRRDERIGS